MNAEVEQTVVRENKYQVESVEKTNSPVEDSKDDWYRYVIGRGNSKIEGMKPGSLNTVTEHAETVAEDLNARATKSSSTYAARKSK